LNALALRIDQTAFDASNAGVANVDPQAFANAGETVASADDFNTDFQAAAAIFRGNWRNACIVMHPWQAAQLALAYGRRGAAEAGPLGGRLLGLPLLVTEGIECDSSGSASWCLLDGSSVMAVDGGVELRPSSVSTVEMGERPGTRRLRADRTRHGRLCFIVRD
jgi:hypothetical protein